MPLQPPQYVGNLDSSNPIGTDSRTIADDSIRNFKEGMRMSFPVVTGAVSSTHGDLNLLAGFASAGRKIMTGQGGITKALFANPTAPTGWTIDAALTSGQMVVTAGTINGTATTGGDVGGTNDPGINNTTPDHRHAVAANQVAVHDGNSQLNSQRFISVQWNRATPADSLEYWLTAGPNFTLEPTYGLTSHPTQDDGTVKVGADWVPKFTATIVCTLNA